MTTNRRFAAGALLAAIAFQTAASGQDKPKIVITPAQQVYRNIPGNEFTTTFTSVAAPEGRNITIDPDDVMPVIDPREGSHKGEFTVTPRFRFLESINGHLPAVAGGPSPAQISQMTETSGSNTVDGKSVASMFYHLVHDHQVPQQQIWDAINRCKEIRAREFGLPGARR